MLFDWCDYEWLCVSWLHSLFWFHFYFLCRAVHRVHHRVHSLKQNSLINVFLQNLSLLVIYDYTNGFISCLFILILIFSFLFVLILLHFFWFSRTFRCRSMNVRLDWSFVSFNIILGSPLNFCQKKLFA